MAAESRTGGVKVLIQRPELEACAAGPQRAAARRAYDRQAHDPGQQPVVRDNREIIGHVQELDECQAQQAADGGRPVYDGYGGQDKAAEQPEGWGVEGRAQQHG